VPPSADVTRSERLFAMAEVLRSRRTGITVAQLADRFGVSERTVHRDLDALRGAHMPVHGERGRGGGLVLDRGYEMPPVNFSAREAAVVLLLGRWALELRTIPFDAPLRTALDKIRSALPVAAQRELGRLDEKLQFLGVPSHDVAPAVRRAVERAVFEGATLEITYVDRKSVQTTRVVRVEAIFVERTDTRLAVHDVAAGERRELRLAGIVAARVTS
jgi:predicted DNA-binding transcriptional regulator YafY